MLGGLVGMVTWGLPTLGAWLGWSQRTRTSTSLGLFNCWSLLFLPDFSQCEISDSKKLRTRLLIRVLTCNGAISPVVDGERCPARTWWKVSGGSAERVPHLTSRAGAEVEFVTGVIRELHGALRGFPLLIPPGINRICCAFPPNHRFHSWKLTALPTQGLDDQCQGLNSVLTWDILLVGSGCPRTDD